MFKAMFQIIKPSLRLFHSNDLYDLDLNLYFDQTIFKVTPIKSSLRFKFQSTGENNGASDDKDDQDDDDDDDDVIYEQTNSNPQERTMARDATTVHRQRRRLLWVRGSS